MKIIRLFTLAILSVLALAAASAPDEQPLVRVNGHTVTASGLERYVNVNRESLALPGLQADAPEELQLAARRDMLQRLINHRVVLQKAREELGDSEQVQARLDRFAEDAMAQMERRMGSRLRIYQMVSSRGLTVEEYRQMLVEELLVRQYLRRVVDRQVAVRPVEVRQYYREHPEEFERPRTIVYRQILFTVADEEEREEMRRRAEQVLEELKQGADFAALAERHSADADRYPGGLHRVEVPESAPDWRPPAVQGLEPGQTPVVREIGGAYAVVRLEDVREARTLSFAKAQDEIRRKLMRQKRRQAEAEHIQALRDRAAVVYLPAARERDLVPSEGDREQ